MMFALRYATPQQWAEIVTADMAGFLPDHASAEYKASGMALSMSLHYKDKPDLVTAMVDLAIEELSHFREVIKVMQDQGLTLQKDTPDAYVNGLRQQLRKGSEAYFLDRLLVGAVIEARGAERFGLVADTLPEGSLKAFYTRITRSEERHYELFLTLADRYFPAPEIDQRLDQLLDTEAALVADLPLRVALH